MLPPGASFGPSWSESLCLRKDNNFVPPRGHLSSSPRLDAILQALILFGPAAWLLVGTLVRFVQLRKTDLVVLPNRRGYLKILTATTLFALQLAHLIHSFKKHSGRDAAAQQLSLFCDGSTFLAASIFSDIVQAGLLYVAWNLCNPVGLPLAGFMAKCVLLVLESQTKNGILRKPYDELGPEDTSGVFGLVFFWWVNRLLWTGSSKILSTEDLPKMETSFDALRIREEMQAQWDKRKKPESRWTLFLTLAEYIWRPNIVILFPRATFTVLRCCQPIFISRAITFVTEEFPPFEIRNEGLVLLLLAVIIYAGMAVTKAIYSRLYIRLRVTIRMALAGIIHNRSLTIKDGIFEDSAAMTIVGSDTETAEGVGETIHNLWADLAEFCVGMYLLYRELGWVFICPLLVILCTSKSVQFLTSNLSDYHKSFVMATQMRVQATKDKLDAIKNIKMMGLVDVMEAKVLEARKQEMKRYVALSKLQIVFIVSAVALNMLSPAITLIAYVIQAEIRGTKAIDVNMVFTSIAIINIVTSPMVSILSTVAELAAMIADFDRMQTYLNSPDREDKREIIDSRYTDAEDGNTETVDRVAVSINNVTIRPASTANPVLKNISAVLKDGKLIVVSGAVGTGKTTLAKALLGDLPPDSGVIRTAYGSIAYCSQTAWLINGTVKDIICGPPHDDDRAVDEEWYKRVVHACDLEEDFDKMLNRDQTVIGSRGITLSGGQKQRVALARAVYARRSLIILDDVLSALDATTERHVVDNLIGPKGLFKELGTTVLLITHAVQHLPLSDYIIILDDKGNIAEQGTWEDLRQEAGYINKVVLKEKDEGENKPQNRAEARDRIQTTPQKIDDAAQDAARKTGDISLYFYYFGTIGPARLILLMACLTTYASLVGFNPYWLRWMAEDDGHHAWFYTGIYLLIALGSFIFLSGAFMVIFLLIAPHSGYELHARLLRTVIHAPQSFFDTTDTGTTLNRFSSDMMMIDMQLPFSLFSIFQAVFRLLSQYILLSIVQPFIVAALPFTFIVLYLIQRIYLPTSRQLRFLDLETRARVNSSFLETLEGVATIRAFGWQRPFVCDNAAKFAQSLQPEYLLSCIQRWLTLVLDLIVPVLAVGIIGLAIAFKGTTTGGQIGIALNVVLEANRYLFNLVEAWTRMETSLGAISRLRTFEKDVLPEDKHVESFQDTPTPSWPDRGAFSLMNPSASYKMPTLALSNVTVNIAPGTKVGVVGRTGSGKSSLLLSLLRIIELEGEGTVRIDGVDICKLPRNTVRGRIITVPQDSMLIMTDSVRENLDIAGTQISDEDMVRVLQRVHLWDVLQSRGASAQAAGREACAVDTAMGLAGASSTTENGEGGSRNSGDATPPVAKVSPTATLDTQMKLLPLSQGQKQLFSLARALLMRPSRGHVVLLDEATSNVDGETDKLMQTLVREEFSEHTVITVAHRLDTIMDSDVVLVLEAGKLVEVGSPSELETREDGAFRALIHGKRA